MQVAVRDLRNETRSVMDAVERGEEVVLTRRGRPIARIVPIDQGDGDLDHWLEAVMSDPGPTGILDDIDRTADADADVERERRW